MLEVLAALMGILLFLLCVFLFIMLLVCVLQVMASALTSVGLECARVCRYCQYTSAKVEPVVIASETHLPVDSTVHEVRLAKVVEC